MTEDHRGDRAAAAQAGTDKERGVGDWQHYQPPSAILKEIAARNAHARLGGPPGPPVSARCAPSTVTSMQVARALIEHVKTQLQRPPGPPGAPRRPPGPPGPRPPLGQPPQQMPGSAPGFPSQPHQGSRLPPGPPGTQQSAMQPPPTAEPPVPGFEPAAEQPAVPGYEASGAAGHAQQNGSAAAPSGEVAVLFWLVLKPELLSNYAAFVCF